MPRQDYDKIVKLACKPKNAPPKAKYLDALIAATFDENALGDITRSLSTRLRDTNPVVEFKALLTLHQMMRAGSAETLLGYLSRNGDLLRLRSVQGGTDGGNYRPPSNLAAYAYYLDARIRGFRELQHDIVYSQNESNRRSNGLGANSKARRLRHLPVEKGLLREVKQVQRMLDALVRCMFYDDNLNDENTVLAFRLLIKDLLVLFQAGNEGVCNILEHYFEMSKTDASDAFDIYKSFIKQTDKIVDYLAIARRLNNVVNVPVPNLKHAPTSLVKALEEYLNDPNFENNRLEYRSSLRVVEGPGGRGKSPVGGKGKAAADSGDKAKAATSSPKPAEASTSAGASASALAAAASASAAGNPAQQKIQDFLDSIQTDQQPTMFGGPASQPMASPPLAMGGMGGMGMGMVMGGMGMQQQQHMAQMNQFGGMSGMGGPMQMQPTGLHPMQMQMTGANPFRQSMMFPQQTGFLGPQMTGFPGGTSPGGSNSPFLQAQPTGFLQPQTPGQMAFNPNRQSTFPMAANPTGSGMEVMSGPAAQTSLLQRSNTMAVPSSQHSGGSLLQRQNTMSNPFRQSTFGTPGLSSNGLAGGVGAPGMFHSNPVTPYPQQSASPEPMEMMRPGSTPALGGSQPQATLLQPQSTGSNNPFAPPGGVPQPAPAAAPKQPSMNDLAQARFQQQFAMAGGLNPQHAQQQQHHQQQQAPQQPAASSTSSWDPFAPTPSAQPQQATPGANGSSSAMSDIASAFAMDSKPAAQNDFMSQFASLSVNTGTGAGGASAASPLQAQNTGFLQPQRTGYGGSTVKPFKPTSSFGSSLMETLPPIPEPNGSGAGAGPNGSGVPASPFAQTPTGSSAAPFGSNSAFGTGSISGISAFGTSSAFGTGSLHASSTGGGLAAQPTGFTPTSAFGQSLAGSQPQPLPLQAQNTGSNPFRQSMFPTNTGFNPGSFGSSPGGAFPGAGAFGAASPFAGQNAGAGAGAGAFPFPFQQQQGQPGQQHQQSLF